MSTIQSAMGETGRAVSRGYCYACPTPIEIGEMWRRERVGNSVPHAYRLVHHPECPVTADHTPERLSAEDRETAVSTIEAIAATHPERYVPVSAGVLRALIDDRDALAAHLADVEARLAAAWKALDEPGWYASQRVSRARAALHPTPDDPA